MVSDLELLSETSINEFAHLVDWKAVSNQEPSEKIIRNNSNRVDWNTIIRWQELSVELLMECGHKINWHLFSREHPITNDICEAFHDRLDWKYIARERQLAYVVLTNKNLNIPKVTRVTESIKQANRVKRVILEATQLPDVVVELIAQYAL